MIQLKPTVNFNREKLRLAAKELGVSVQFLGYDQARLLGLNLVSITAPSKKLIKVDGTKPEESERKIGEGAVMEDLNRIFIVAGNESILDTWDIVGIPAVAFRTASGAVFGIEKTMIDRSGTRMAEHHKKYRSPKTGRVSKAGSYTRNIGRWKFIDKLAVDKTAFNRYAKERRKNVGTLKAGWVKGAVYFASKCNGAANVPTWISRNEDRFSGPGAGGTLSRLGIGKIWIENTSTFARIKIQKSFITAALATREKDLAKNLIKRKDVIAEQFNRESF